MFGRTQVGKTTLILELMGVAPRHAARVSTVLRGRREIGKSATATAMEYRRSPDDRWRLKWGTEQTFDDDAAMEAELAALREHMSTGRFKADAPVVVSIPAGCFETGEDTGPHARMLDLPGDNPREGAEQKHVSAMAEKYVPNADLILLVGRADSLSFLNSATLTLPGIQDWRIIPQRFRIVTTYSFTPETQRRLVEACDETLGPDFFRRRLRQQIETFGRRLPEDEVPSDLLFPLEFGKSWANQAARSDGFYERVNPVVAALKRQLHHDIKTSATQYERLRSAIQVHVIADNVKRACLAGLDAALDVGRTTLNALENEQTQVANRMKAALGKVEQLADMHALEGGVAKAIEQDCQQIGDEAKARGAKLIGKLETNRNSFSLQIMVYASDLLSKAVGYRPQTRHAECAHFWTNIEPAEELTQNTMRDAIQSEFRALRKKLEGYFMDEYFPNISDDFTGDKALLNWAMTAAAHAARDGLVAHWQSVANERFGRMKREQALAVSRASLALHDLEEVAGRVVAQQEAVAKGERERLEFCERMDRDRATSGAFKAYLDEAYLRALRERMRDAYEAPTPAQSLLMLLSAAQMGVERKNILAGQ
ncbi:hypothetical protein [Paraburkholderia sp. J69-1]|uniref:hypothetical protein n=1 Tax=Paraburkholderia sp. J69-1 TaxID=2805436 RepID=UPI002AB72D4C|nr:hypothetical protein [Paraburkholderia sp. J69-1]